jgi:hypothetical protein
MVTAQRKPVVVGRPPPMATLHLQMPLWIVRIVKFIATYVGLWRPSSSLQPNVFAAEL